MRQPTPITEAHVTKLASCRVTHGLASLNNCFENQKAHTPNCLQPTAKKHDNAFDYTSELQRCVRNFAKPKPCAHKSETHVRAKTRICKQRSEVGQVAAACNRAR